MILEHLVVGQLQSNCYILADEKNGSAIVIDPGEEGQRIADRIAGRSWEVTAILNTHGHFDHVAGNARLVSATGAPLFVPRLDASILDQAPSHAMLYGLNVDPSPKPDRLLDDGDIVELNGSRISVVSTPGHTPGGVTFLTVLGVFAGDSLFAGSIGRTDLPGGDYDTLIRSIREKILVLPDDTNVYPGHGPPTTVGAERLGNPFLREGQ